MERLSKQFVKKSMLSSNISVVKAVEDVSFSLYNGEVLVIAGESGSGKSTIAKLIYGVFPKNGVSNVVTYKDKRIPSIAN